MIAVYARLCRTAWAGSCTSWYTTDEGKIVNNPEADKAIIMGEYRGGWKL